MTLHLAWFCCVQIVQTAMVAPRSYNLESLTVENARDVLRREWGLLAKLDEEDVRYAVLHSSSDGSKSTERKLTVARSDGSVVSRNVSSETPGCLAFNGEYAFLVRKASGESSWKLHQVTVAKDFYKTFFGEEIKRNPTNAVFYPLSIVAGQRGLDLLDNKNLVIRSVSPADNHLVSVKYEILPHVVSGSESSFPGSTGTWVLDPTCHYCAVRTTSSIGRNAAGMSESRTLANPNDRITCTRYSLDFRSAGGPIDEFHYSDYSWKVSGQNDDAYLSTFGIQEPEGVEVKRKRFWTNWKTWTLIGILISAMTIGLWQLRHRMIANRGA